MDRARHLRENQLFECYLAERDGEPIDPPVAEHLADCQPCGARYVDLSQFMDRLHEEAAADADAVFPPDRLQAQQREIARRIEAVGRPSRVISFPSHAVHHAPRASRWRFPPRWTAAAAAAGLFVGVALGASFEWEMRAPPRRAVLRAAADSRADRVPATVVRPVLASDSGADAAFLSELELALDRPRTRELVAFDAFTPHVRDIRDQR